MDEMEIKGEIWVIRGFVEGWRGFWWVVFEDISNFWDLLASLVIY
ncbi:hypothetical protein [Bacillus infantis]|nr:hypothetical protein [Bacillus infantis]